MKVSMGVRHILRHLFRLYWGLTEARRFFATTAKNEAENDEEFVHRKVSCGELAT